MARTTRELIDELTRDLDLLVFRLERPAPDPAAERPTIRRELERLQRRLGELSDRMGE